MQNNDFLSFHSTKERAPNTFLTFGSNLKQTLSHGSGVGLAYDWAKFFNNFKYVEVICKNPGREPQRFLFNFAIEERYFSCHSERLSNMITLSSGTEGT